MATPSSVSFLADAQIWRLGKHNTLRIVIHNPIYSILFSFLSYISFFLSRIFL
jgi:hypothetical protein